MSTIQEVYSQSVSKAYLTNLQELSVECVKQCNSNLNSNQFTTAEKACYENCAYRNIENLSLSFINK